jgi:hypothetical protein
VLYLKKTENKDSWKITNMMGKGVLFGTSKTTNISFLPNGLYILNINGRNTVVQKQ